MKTRILPLLLLVLAAPLAAQETAPAPVDVAPKPAPAAPTEKLAAAAAVFTAPDAKSAVIARLKAGAAITPSSGGSIPGWRRIELDGPFVGFAHNRDITKALTVREGGSIHVAPRADSPVLTVAGKDDQTDVTGLAPGGEWCQIKLQKPLAGYIATGEVANTPAGTAAPVIFSAPASAAGSGSTVGRPAAVTGGTADLPRIFQGRLVTAATLLNRNPVYDYQLVDDNNHRIAYVDLKRVVLNDRIENVLNRIVTLNGTLRNTVDGKELVVVAESLQVK